jgi:hypothetical protein
VLRGNDQLVGGAKDELVERCVDGELNGGLPKCPKCGIGRLKVSGHDGTLYCPGYFEEAADAYMPCGFRAAPDKVTRLPWKVKARKKAKARPREDTPESEGGSD